MIQYSNEILPKLGNFQPTEKTFFRNFQFFANLRKYSKTFKMTQYGEEILPRLSNFRASVEKFYFSYHTVD